MIDRPSAAIIDRPSAKLADFPSAALAERLRVVDVQLGKNDETIDQPIEKSLSTLLIFLSAAIIDRPSAALADFPSAALPERLRVVDQ